MLYWWFPRRFDMVRMGFLVLPLKYVHKAHSSCELIKDMQRLSPDLCLFCHGC